MKKVNRELRESISERLVAEKLLFLEFNSRMNYEMIGQIKNGKNNDVILLIFRGSFYCHDRHFSLNEKTLNLIKDIQNEYDENTRDKNNRITTVESGIGYFE